MFSALWAKIKEIVSKMFGMNQSIEETLHITPAVSNKMVEAIDEWTLMYEDRAEWLHEPDSADPTMVVSLGLPAFIASEKARMAVLELKSEITAPKETEEVANPDYFPPTTDALGNVRVSGVPKTIIKETVLGDTARADYMNEQYQTKLMSKIRTQLEYGIAKGSLIIKPYVVSHKVAGVEGIDNAQSTEQVTEEVTYEMNYDFIQADCFYPFSFNSSGDLIDVAFIQTKTDKDNIYTRLERHRLEGNNVIIENKAFQASTNYAMYDDPSVGSAKLGKEIPLTSVPEWKDIPPRATVKNVSKLLFGYFKMPDANTIDPHSPLGMSGFAKAKYLIREADKQYSRLLWEYEAGEMAIDIDRDALQFMEDNNGDSGHSVMPSLQKRLWRQIDLGESDTYKPYSPALRDASIITGLNTILMRIEDVCALSRGTISDVAAEARTATELKILRQRSYSSNLEIQHALETALRDVVYAMNVYCTLYNIVGDVHTNEQGEVDASKLGQYDVSFMWDDSILVDVETELQKRLTLQNAGLESKVGVRMWYFGETEKQARDALAKIDEERQEAIEKNMQVSSQLGASIGKGQQDVMKAQAATGTGEQPSEEGGQSLSNENAQ